MPKKLHTNPKAVEANERKAAQKKEKQDKENKAKEDAKWVVCAFYALLSCSYIEIMLMICVGDR